MYQKICSTIAAFGVCACLMAEESATLQVDFNKELGKVNPRTGFLGGLRLTLPEVEENEAYPLTK